jgi:biopolymer transport protein ExbB/TolQ
MPATITVVCPYCEHRMRAAVEHVGRKGRCIHCQKLIEIVPSGDRTQETIQPTEATGFQHQWDARLSSTNVPVWLAGLIALAATVLLYLAIFLPLHATYLGQLFVKRGPMQHCTTLVTCWGLSLLAMKYRAVKRQKSYAELELKLIPLDIGLQITRDNVDQFLDHLHGLGRAERLSILGRRIQGALEHFKARRSVPELQQYLATQAELDSSSVDAGYVLLKSFIWVIPLLGFIGTVTGISSAVTGMDAIVRQGTGSEQLMAGLREVTQGLAVAFDTTFLALVMAIVLLFPTEALRKTEYAMLDRIEAFINESLLRRMADDQPGSDGAQLPGLVAGALEPLFREHQRWLAQWQAQVSQLGQTIGADFEVAFQRIEKQISQTESARLRQTEELSRLWDALFDSAQKATTAWQQSSEEMRSRSQSLHEVIGHLERTLSESGKRAEAVWQQQARMWDELGRSDVVQRLGELVQQLGKLVDRIPAAPPAAVARTETIVPLEPAGSTNEHPVVAPGPARRRGVWSRLFGRYIPKG